MRIAQIADIIKIKEDWDTYGILAGEVYIVGYKNDKLVALPKISVKPLILIMGI